MGRGGIESYPDLSQLYGGYVTLPELPSMCFD